MLAFIMVNKKDKDSFLLIFLVNTWLHSQNEPAFQISHHTVSWCDGCGYFTELYEEYDFSQSIDTTLPL